MHAVLQWSLMHNEKMNTGSLSQTRVIILNLSAFVQNASPGHWKMFTFCKNHYFIELCIAWIQRI